MITLHNCLLWCFFLYVCPSVCLSLSVLRPSCCTSVCLFVAIRCLYNSRLIQADQIATLAKDRSAWRSLVVACSAAEGWWWWQLYVSISFRGPFEVFVVHDGNASKTASVLLLPLLAKSAVVAMVKADILQLYRCLVFYVAIRYLFQHSCAILDKVFIWCCYDCM